MKKKSGQAFSLVEISVVLLIISIIIIGIIEGKKIIKKAKLNNLKIITQNSGVADMEGLALWYETALEDSFENLEGRDNTAISVWHNRNLNGGSRIDATQATVGNQPKFYDNVFNGLIPAVRFDGIDDFLNISDGSALLNTPYTIFVVEQRRSDSSQQPFVGSVGNTANQNLFLGYSQDGLIGYSQHQHNNAVTFAVSGYSVPTPTLHTFMLNLGSGMRYWRNGSGNISASDANKTTALSALSGLGIGRFSQNNGSNYSYFNGDIAEIIIFKRSLQSPERKQIEGYLGTKYNIAVIHEGSTCTVSAPGVAYFPNEEKTVVAGGPNPYRCADGYSGNPTYSCATNSTIIVSGCVVDNPCPVLTLPANGIFDPSTASSQTSTVGTTVVLTCTAGNAPSGVASTTCQSSGNWSPATLGTCVPIVCTGVGTSFASQSVPYQATPGNDGGKTCDTGYGGTPSYTCTAQNTSVNVAGCRPCKGGTENASSNYVSHSFTSGGNLTCSASVNAEYLIVGGGGGGGGGAIADLEQTGGGGGAGGYLTNVGGSTISLTSAAPYSITIGSGGIGGGGVGGASSGASGGNSTFFGLTAAGGGGGGKFASAGVAGGSAGGNGGLITSPTSPSPSGQGNAGGIGGPGPGADYASGGGGGSSAAGSNAISSGAGGAGGSGKSSNISGSSVTYAGGGGGGACYNSSSGGAGGSGIGGNGGNGLPGGQNGFNAAVGSYGSGGGGAATGDGAASEVGGSGSDGVVIVRYAIANICTVPSIPNGTVTINPSNDPAQLNNVATLTCDSGYVLLGNATATCVGPNTWSQSLGTCAGCTCTGCTPSSPTGYKIFIFSTVGTNSGSLTCTGGNLNADYLVVGGGGGGGGGAIADLEQTGGGGGAGGYRTGSSMQLTSAAPYYITIGAGGAGGGGASASSGANGGESTFNGITAAGGGGGGRFAYAGVAGGSAGGNGGLVTTPTSPSPSGQGNAGGIGGPGPGQDYASGGGGGSSAAGSNAISNGSGGAGGSGTLNSISGSSLPYAAGGGGGACYFSNPGGAGGSGIGGKGGDGLPGGQNGSSPANVSIATGGYGSGGGGAATGNDAAYEVGGSGSAGIVIVRYATP